MPRYDESQFGQYLEADGLLPSTREKYESILIQATSEDRDLVRWFSDKMMRRDIPFGTAITLRSAVRHYLVGVVGYDPLDVEEALPKTTGLRMGKRQPLTERQLAVYLAAVDDITIEPARTILKLLPITGLKIGEITTLKRENLVERNGDWFFLLRTNTGRTKMVPLGTPGRRVLTEYLEFAHDPYGLLFPGRSGAAIQPQSIRKYTAKLARDYPDLKGLSPEVIRQTALAFGSLA